MRAVIQRVSSACVQVEGKEVGRIGVGIMVLVGIGRNDVADDALWLAKKVLTCRLFDSRDGKPWAESVSSLGLELLVISQFTLHASARKPKPDFHRSMAPGAASGLFDQLLAELRSAHGPSRLQTGVFGAMMEVSLVNTGPVTVTVDSKNRQDRAPEDEKGGEDEPSSTPSFPALEEEGGALGGTTPCER